jgi:hypothetical protein
LTDLGPNSRSFSECTLILQPNLSDFDSAMLIYLSYFSDSPVPRTLVLKAHSAARAENSLAGTFLPARAEAMVDGVLPAVWGVTGWWGAS